MAGLSGSTMEKPDSLMTYRPAACLPQPGCPRVEVLPLPGLARVQQSLCVRQWLQEAYPQYRLDETARPYRLCDAAGQALAGVSFSYMAGWAVLAIAGGADVGLDICEVQPVPDALAVATLYLSASAVQQIRVAANPAQVFAQEWVRFEAALKCQGQGIAEGSGEVVNAAGLHWHPFFTAGSAIGVLVTRPF